MEARDGPRELQNMQRSFRTSQKTLRRRNRRKEGKVNVLQDEDMDEIWLSCLALTPEDATTEQRAPPPKEPSSPSSVSSTFEHDLSEEEDQDLMVMPDLSSPGGMLAAEGKAQTSSMCMGNARANGGGVPSSHPISQGNRGSPSTANASSSNSLSVGPVPVRPATASWGGEYRNTRERHSLMRIARLNYQVGAIVPEQSMLHAMFAAARVGAESLDPYAPLWSQSERMSAPASTSTHGQARAGCKQSSEGAPREPLQGLIQTVNGAFGEGGISTSRENGASNAGAHDHQQQQPQQHQQQQHHQHHHLPPPTAAQHLESMLPWNRDPYLRGVRAMMGPPSSPGQFGISQNVDEMGSGWDDAPSDPVSRLHRSIGHVNHSKVRRQPEAKPRAATARGGRPSKAAPQVELPPKRPATAAPPVRTEVFKNVPITYVAADPFALTNARMISDMLDKPSKPKDPKKSKSSARRPAGLPKTQGASQAPPSDEGGEAATRKALFLKKRNDPAHAAPLSSRSKKPSLADVEAAKLDQRLQFAQAKQAAVSSACLSSSPLKAKASRPSSALVASCLPFHPSSPHPGHLSSAGQSGRAAWTSPATGGSDAQDEEQQQQQQQQQAFPHPFPASNKTPAADVQAQSPGKAGMPSSASAEFFGAKPSGTRPGQASTGKKAGAGPTPWGAGGAEPWPAGMSSRGEGRRTVSTGGNAGAPSASGTVEWPRSGLSEWGVLRAAEDMRRAMTELAVDDICAANSMPFDNPLAQTRARMQPGALRSEEALTSLYPRPSSAAVAMVSVPHQHPGHGLRPGSAIPVLGVASSDQRPSLFGQGSKGLKAAVESEMFITEAFEDRKKGAFEHLGEVGRVLRRYQQQPNRSTLQLNHCIRSIDQVGALADVLVQLPEVETLFLAGNDLDDQAFSMLGSQNVLNSPGAASLTSLNLSDNRLGPASMKLLLPLLRHDQPPEMPDPPDPPTPGSRQSRRVRHEGNSSPEDPKSPGLETQKSGIQLRPLSEGPGGDQAGTAPRDAGEFTSWRALKDGSKETPPDASAWLEESAPEGTPAEVAKSWRMRAMRLIRSGKRHTVILKRGIPSLKMLAAPPMRGAQLSMLDLSGNLGIKDIGIELLASVMQGSRVGLQEMRVSCCGLGERSAAALGKALSNTCALEYLDLSWNRLGLHGARSLADGIKDSHAGLQLATLKVDNSGIGDQGCAHLAQALQTNASVRVLDISGNGVSSDTAMVLSATLRVNKTLRCLVMRDNPLGFVAGRRLLQVIHASSVEQLDLMGCSFYKSMVGASSRASLEHVIQDAVPSMSMSNVTTAFDPKEPEGAYKLDLANPGHRQVAVELIRLATDQGLVELRGALLNEKPAVITLPDQLPLQGTFGVRAIAKGYTYEDDAPLSEEGFKSRWLQLVASEQPHYRDPYLTASASKALSTLYSPSPSVTPLSTSPSRPSTALRPQSGSPVSHRSIISNAHPSSAQKLGNQVHKASDSAMQPAEGKQHKSAGPDTVSAADQTLARLMGDQTLDGRHEVSGRSRRGSVRGNISQGQLWSVLEESAEQEHGGLGQEQEGERDSSPPRVSSSRPASAALSSSLNTLTQVRAASDEWRMSLLEVLLADAYLTCSQLRQVVECMHEPEARLRAALLGFGVLFDPHLLHTVLDVLDTQQAAAFRETLGPLIMYHPANPTGAWSLRMNKLQDAIVARHLLVDFLQQHHSRLTKHPHHICFTLLVINGKHQDLPANPHKLVLPSSGSLDLYFVDLRPVEAPASPPAPPLPPPPAPSSSPQPSAAADKPPAQARAPTSSEPAAPTAPGMRFKSAALAAAAEFRASKAAAVSKPKAEPAQEAPKSPKEAAPIPVKEPVVLVQPVLMQQQQMDALVAALQHWRKLDPFKLVQLVDTSGCMSMQEAMLALGYSVWTSWEQAFMEQARREESPMPLSDEDSWSKDISPRLGKPSDTQGQLRPQRRPSSGGAGLLNRIPSFNHQRSSTGFSLASSPKEGFLSSASVLKEGQEKRSRNTGNEKDETGANFKVLEAEQRLQDVRNGRDRRPSSPGSAFSRASLSGRGSYGLDEVGLRDHEGFVEAMRMLAVFHYVTCDQLARLLALLPFVNERGVASLGVELCTTFWARTVDRKSTDPTKGGWTSVMRRLAPQQQVCLAQRLGYMNIFNKKRPAMHYRLRMYRQDEHEIAWQLFNMAINASHTCFLDFHVDGVPKKVNQGPGMWPVMRGNAASGTVPQTVCEFDFSWDHKLVAEAEKKKKAQKGRGA